MASLGSCLRSVRHRSIVSRFYTSRRQVSQAHCQRVYSQTSYICSRWTTPTLMGVFLTCRRTAHSSAIPHQQMFFTSRNIGSVTSKVIHFQYRCPSISRTPWLPRIRPAYREYGLKRAISVEKTGSDARKSSGLSRVRLIVVRLIEGHLYLQKEICIKASKKNIFYHNRSTSHQCFRFQDEINCLFCTL